ncbi:MAG: NADPH-dependent FMN reductase, partial [Ligilactobacillus sp.]|nr:NADPH-dependent FMN reductase [Ligilactobacillus sp.]
TDAALRTMDKVMTTLGLIKAGEAVQTNTYFLTTLSAKKQVELSHLGQKAGTLQRKDDQTVKRYIELFFIVAVMAFITMLIQMGVLHLLGQTLGFWNNYISFVVIFFILLSITLHFFTVVKHKRK